MVVGVAAVQRDRKQESLIDMEGHWDLGRMGANACFYYCDHCQTKIALILMISKLVMDIWQDYCSRCCRVPWEPAK